MKFSDKFIRRQLELTKSFADGASLDTARGVQDKLGKILQFANRRDTVIKNCDFGEVPGAIVIPRDEVRSGIIFYIHGGGYVAGGLDYAKGFASVLSAECGMRTACVEYRLAPENPYPAAIEDVYSAYLSLLSSGYTADSIIFAGESAGGALAYALALKIREQGTPMPAGIIAISPWCDLTLSGDSYEKNKSVDPSLTKERLEYYADCYVGALSDTKPLHKKAKRKNTETKKNPLKETPYVSPAFADLTGMPPTLIFAGGDEILLSDAERMHEKFLECNVPSKLVVRPKMWHAYHLYCLKSSKGDFELINGFIKRVLPAHTERKLRWMSLDNAAKIYPAARTSNWTNVFRLSATLKDDVDREVLQSALDVTVRRFPSIAVRLRRGTFWYYLEEIPHAPTVKDEKPYPIARMPFDDIRSCAFRVIVYKKRIAVEFFHALTDGNGGMVFLKTLVAEYLTEKYGINVPNELGVLDRLETPLEEELEDCFPKHSGKIAASRKEADSYRIWGEAEKDGFCNNTTFIIDSPALTDLAHSYGVTVTALLGAAFIKAGINLQNEETVSLKRRKPVKVLIPCDLRRLYGAKTLRNFVLYSTPGVDPRLGEYTFREISEIVYKQMTLDITEKNMSARIKTNVKDEENMILKLTPLFLKNIVMKAVFKMCGEKKSMLTVSNLGVIRIPDKMAEFVERFDFVLSVQSSAPYNAGTLSYGGKTYINIIRNIKESRLEKELYNVLKKEGIDVKVESNQR